jgi:hypothetical protein
MRRSILLAAVTLALASGVLVSVFVILRIVQPRSVLASPSVSLIWPLSGSTTPDVISITSPFGPRWQISQNRTDYHPGIDIKADEGTPVHAVAAGIATEVGYLSAEAGLGVVISHPLMNYYSAYLHLSLTNTNVNDVVTQGQVIGFVGQTGNTEFSHLHFEIRLTANNYPTSTQNPMGYLPRSDVTTPAIQIVNLYSVPIYSPTASVVISMPRSELDLNQISVTLRDRSTGLIVDSQLVDFNRRLNTGSDSLSQNGIVLDPNHFNETATTYLLTANFNNLHALDSFTLTARAIDLAGHIGTATAVALDTTPPGQVTTLVAHRRSNGVALSWIAPGDSDFIGRAMTYEVRFTSTLIGSQFFWAAGLPVLNPPTPITGSQLQSWLITQPLADPVYFALVAYDEEGNVSTVSDPPAQAIWATYLPLILK